MFGKIIFSTQEYQYLIQKIQLADPNIEIGQLDIKDFPDGEHYHRIVSDVKNKSVYIIGGTINDKATLELFDIANGCVQLGAASLNLIIPYFGYSTMERSVLPGEIVKAKTRALLFSSIPPPPMGVKVTLFDLHSEGIPYYFNSDIMPQHIYCKDIFKKIIQEQFDSNVVLAATDAGRAKWVESLANDLGVTGAFVYKKRLSETEVSLSAVNAPVNNKNVVIYDDMIRTGGSLIQAAKAYHLAGAQSITVMTTHGIFTDNAIDKILSNSYIKSIISLDTHPYAINYQHSKLQVISIAPLILSLILNEN